MGIVKQTSTELIFQNKPGSFLLIWAAGFSGIPLVMMCVLVFSVGVSTLSCRRIAPTQIDCQQTHSKLFGLVPEPSISVNNLVGSKVDSETRTDSDGDYKAYQVTLLSRSGAIPFIEYSRGEEEEKQAISQRIQSFINSTEPSLIVDLDRRWKLETFGIILFLSIFVSVGMLVLFYTFLVETLKFEKNPNRLTRQVHNFFGIQMKQEMFDKITGVRLKEDTDSDGDRHYELKLVSASAVQDYKLMHSYNNDREIKAMKKRILEFLQLPDSQS